MEAIILAVIQAALAGYEQWKQADAATKAQLEQQAAAGLSALKGEAADEDAGHAADLGEAKDAIAGKFDTSDKPAT